jgi:hypothetical protein
MTILLTYNTNINSCYADLSETETIPLLQSSGLEEITSAEIPPSRHDWQHFASTADSGRRRRGAGHGENSSCCQDQLLPACSCTCQNKKPTPQEDFGKSAKSCQQYWQYGNRWGSNEDQSEPSGTEKEEAVDVAQKECSSHKRIGDRQADDVRQTEGDHRQADDDVRDGPGVDPLGLVATLRERLQQMTADLERVKAAADRLHERLDEPPDDGDKMASALPPSAAAWDWSFTDNISPNNILSKISTENSHTTTESPNWASNVQSQSNNLTEAREMAASPNPRAFWQQPMRIQPGEGLYPMANQDPSQRR